MIIKTKSDLQPNPDNYENYIYHKDIDPDDTGHKFILYKKIYVKVPFVNQTGLDYVIVPSELATIHDEAFKFICIDVVGSNLLHNSYESRMLQQITSCARIESWDIDAGELFIYVFGLLRNPDKNQKWSGTIDIALSFYGY